VALCTLALACMACTIPLSQASLALSFEGNLIVLALLSVVVVVMCMLCRGVVVGGMDTGGAFLVLRYSLVYCAV
jgi:hypothetical protein